VATVAFLEGHRIVPTIRSDRFPKDRRWTHRPFLVLANKCDDESMLPDFEVFCELNEEPWHCLPISAETGFGVEAFKRAVYDTLEIMRIYSKAPGRDPDLSAPFVLKRGSTV